MPSRISQMRNGQQPSQTQAQSQQFQIDPQYLNQLKTIMHSNNSGELLTNLALQNPQIQQLLSFAKSGGNLQSLAAMIAKQKGADLNQVMNQLMG